MPTISTQVWYWTILVTKDFELMLTQLFSVKEWSLSCMEKVQVTQRKHPRNAWMSFSFVQMALAIFSFEIFICRVHTNKNKAGIFPVPHEFTRKLLRYTIGFMPHKEKKPFWLCCVLAEDKSMLMHSKSSISFYSFLSLS